MGGQSHLAVVAAAAVIVVVSIMAIPARAAYASGDASEGSDLFEQECSECHSVVPGRNKKGPSLFHVIGRRSGSLADYRYSDAMKNAHLTWTPQTLARYLSGPRKIVPGTRMKYSGLRDPRDQSDLIAFLESQH